MLSLPHTPQADDPDDWPTCRWPGSRSGGADERHRDDVELLLRRQVGVGAVGDPVDRAAARRGPRAPATRPRARSRGRASASSPTPAAPGRPGQASRISSGSSVASRSSRLRSPASVSSCTRVRTVGPGRRARSRRHDVGKALRIGELAGAGRRPRRPGGAGPTGRGVSSAASSRARSSVASVSDVTGKKNSVASASTQPLRTPTVPGSSSK